ncbi:MAG TPA: hypothetical protein VGO93_08030, partial [Candidatus Xenobia bacterium]
MTCPHCAFENMENEVHCFRCGQSLDLSDVDIVPRRHNLLCGRLERFWNRSVFRPEKVQGRPALAAFLSMVPGLGHCMVLGDPRRGALMLGIYLTTVFVAWMSHPADVGSWVGHPDWLLVTTQAWVACDAYQRRRRQDGHRALPVELGLVSVAAMALFYAVPLYA